MKTDSHKSKILKALMKGRKLTKLHMLTNFGCWNSGDVIYNLRREGWPIKTKMVKVKDNTEIAQYYIDNADLINLKKS